MLQLSGNNSETLRMRRLTLSFLICLSWVGVSFAETTPWVSGLGYKARLIIGAMMEEGYYQGGFEVELEEGWKTYWRISGDSGIPPLFDVKNSSNLQNFEVLWPAPRVFKDGAGKGIGYKKRVLLPLNIRPEDPQQTIDFNLSIFFGVCSEICVPADVSFSSLLSPNNIRNENMALVQEALAQVPVAASPVGFNVKSALLIDKNDKEFAELDVRLPKGTKDLLVLVEGPRDWYFDPLKVSMNELEAADTTKLRVPLHRIAKDALGGDETLRLTIIADGEAIEQTIALQ